ncbi:hypothetical protein GGR57DRAFT_472695 [Xylariaceae sp. FL1272]|nr:hypothetical protein GGR57DRAFT_472695 [Xylariaceae sp. FL1272]
MYAAQLMVALFPPLHQTRDTQRRGSKSTLSTHSKTKKMLQLLIVPLLATLSVGQGIQWNIPYQNATSGASPIICNKNLVVQQGDTCEKICVFKGLSLAEFLKVNPEVSLETHGSCPLQTGQTVCVDKVGRTRLTTSSLTSLPPWTSDFSSTSTSTVTPTETVVVTVTATLTSESTPPTPEVPAPSVSSSSSMLTSSPVSTETDGSTSISLPLPQPQTSTSSTEVASQPTASDTTDTSTPTSLHVIPAPHPPPDTKTESNHVIPVPDPEPTPTDVHVIPVKNSPTGAHVIPVAKPSMEQRHEAEHAEETSENKKRGLWDWVPSTFRTSTRDSESL